MIYGLTATVYAKGFGLWDRLPTFGIVAMVKSCTILKSGQESLFHFVEIPFQANSGSVQRRPRV